METADVLLVAAVGGGLFLVLRKRQQDAIAAGGGGGGGVGGAPFDRADPTGIVHKLAGAAGGVANVVGTAIGSKYLGPFGKVVGKSASIDTQVNILKTNDAVFNVANAIRGHESVGSAAKAVAGDVVATAVSPLKTAYGIATGWL